MKRLAAYDVYLRTSAGTVKRTVHLNERSVTKAGLIARSAIMRVVREDVQILDVVPLKRIEGKTTNGRRVTTTKVRYVQTRRAKARPSARLSRKGKPLTITREETVTPHVPVTERLRNVKVKLGPFACTNDSCLARGSCSHVKRTKERFQYRGEVNWKGSRSTVLVVAEDAEQARATIRANLRKRHLVGARITKLRKVGWGS